MQRRFKALWVWVAATSLMWVSPLHAGEEDSDLGAQVAQAERALEDAARHLADLMREKYGANEKKAMLGVLLGDAPHRSGIALVGTTPDSGAAMAGLQAGDRLVGIDGVSLENEDPLKTLSMHMRDVAPGDVVRVMFERDGERRQADIVTHARTAHIMRMLAGTMDKIQIEVGAGPGENHDIAVIRDLQQDGKLEQQIEKIVHNAHAHAAEIASAHGQGHYAELIEAEGSLAGYFGVDAGVVVLRPQPDSELRGGDVLLQVGDQAVASVADATRLLQTGGGKQARVRRDGKTVTVTLGEAELRGSPQVRVIALDAPCSPAEEDS